jgi:phosphoribosylaminoimidazole-succinocarboxamide synthase
MMTAILQTNIKGAKLLNRGKVRDIYEVPDKKGGAPYFMLVATDRLSAFDVVMNEPIPDKGRVLTQISNFWFEKFKDILPNHVISTTAEGYIDAPDSLKQLEGRALICRKAKPLAIEAIVRGYLVGSGWKEYQKKGTVCDIMLPIGMKLASKLPQPLFTPSTKAEMGAHDENISPEEAGKIIGAELAKKVADYSVKLYQAGADYAATRGIILADTKFEFGLLEDGTLILIDEVLTPDSSRFWPADGYVEGENPPSFDKQFVRDWLEAAGWDKKAPAPALPAEIIQKTADKYREAYTRLTGKAWGA